MSDVVPAHAGRSLHVIVINLLFVFLYSVLLLRLVPSVLYDFADSTDLARSDALTAFVAVRLYCFVAALFIMHCVLIHFPLAYFILFIIY